MSDLISRQDALEQLCEDCRFISAEDCEYRDVCKTRNFIMLLPSADAVQIPIKLEKRYPQSRDEDITDAFMRGYLAGRSSADRPTEWIPVSERLPEDKCDVLVLFNWNMAVGCIYDGEWRINSGDNFCTAVFKDEPKPIAWMPLPEPYREDDEE